MMRLRQDTRMLPKSVRLPLPHPRQILVLRLRLHHLCFQRKAHCLQCGRTHRQAMVLDHLKLALQGHRRCQSRPCPNRKHIHRAVVILHMNQSDPRLQINIRVNHLVLMHRIRGVSPLPIPIRLLLPHHPIPQRLLHHRLPLRCRRIP